MDRWQVELHVWTALIAILLLKYLQLRSRFAWSLSNLVALLRMNLFVHRDLWTWLDQPFGRPPTTPGAWVSVVRIPYRFAGRDLTPDRTLSEYGRTLSRLGAGIRRSAGAGS